MADIVEMPSVSSAKARDEGRVDTPVEDVIRALAAERMLAIVAVGVTPNGEYLVYSSVGHATMARHILQRGIGEIEAHADADVLDRIGAVMSIA